jgi:hypothetical protein
MDECSKHMSPEQYKAITARVDELGVHMSRRAEDARYLQAKLMRAMELVPTPTGDDR